MGRPTSRTATLWASRNHLRIFASSRSWQAASTSHGRLMNHTRTRLAINSRSPRSPQHRDEADWHAALHRSFVAGNPTRQQLIATLGGATATLTLARCA